MTLQTLHSASFGRMLRDWRRHRRLSQLALAEALDIPLRERNALLERSGFFSFYSEAALSDRNMALFREALELALAHHEPYPGLVLDGRWNVIMANQGALRFFGQFVETEAALAAIGAPRNFQVVRLCLDERGYRPFIVNWEEVIYGFLQRARRALLYNPGDAPLAGLIAEILDAPGAPSRWHTPDWTTPPAPAVNMVMRRGDAAYSLFTMLAHFGSPRDVTVEELSVETFYPADDVTRMRLLALASPEG